MSSRLGPDADRAGAVKPVDLRLVPAAVATWLGVLAGLHAPPGWLVAGGTAITAGWAGFALVRRRERRSVRTRLAIAIAVVAALAGMAVGYLRAEPVRHGPVAELAASEAFIGADAVVTDDPSIRAAEAAGEPYVVVRLRLEDVVGRGERAKVRTPVLLISSDLAWSELLPGTPVRVTGRLASASGALAAFLRTDDAPEVLGPASLVSRATEPFRAGLRAAVSGLGPTERGLVPGLAIGDDGALPDADRADMRATGLTHLTAVSGMHVGIVLIAALAIARSAGVRGYGVPAVAVLTLVAFALLVRPDPSVVRASTMGMISVLGLSVAGHKRALPALACAVLVLLLVDPWLGVSIGFALSVLSTVGILVLAAHWCELIRWLPRTLAQALTVPVAAQVASIPVLVGFVSETSLASVPANLLAAPAVAPATLLGVAAAVVAPVSGTVASALAWLAGWPARWIATVAEHGADLPGAVVRWAGGAGSVVASVGVVAVLVAVMPRLLRRPLWTAVAASLVVFVLAAAPTVGWPPRGWVMVACPVGQGDAFVIAAGDGAAMVVDAGPDTDAVDRCLDDLGVTHVPLLVLTHFHRDHVDGVPGVLAGRRVDGVLVSPLPEPVEQVEKVTAWLAAGQVPVGVARTGEERLIGDSVRVRVVWPRRIIGWGESAANDASVVLDVLVHDVRILLTGDIEPVAQRALLSAEPELEADVLKVPHHGSRAQEPALLTELGASIAVIGVGADNRHGHPSPDVIDMLGVAGMVVGRTDTDGAVAVVLTPDGELGVATRGAGVYARGRGRESSIRRSRTVAATPRRRTMPTPRTPRGSRSASGRAWSSSHAGAGTSTTARPTTRG